MKEIKEKYNIDKLVKVKVNNFYPSRWYSFKKEKRFLGIITREDGIYDIYNENIGKNIPQNHTVIDGKLYENPEVILYYEGDINKTYYFDTYQDAQNFASELTNDRKFID